MADTFFDFDTSLNNGENFNSADPDEDECLENEEEYDALNDETFGALEDISILDDWEQQHEQFAIAESSKNSGNLDNSISQRVLDDSEDRLSLSSSVWSYTPTPKNGDAFNTSILASLQNSSKSFIETHDSSVKSFSDLDNVRPLLPAQPKKICTVEELEKSLINSSKNAIAPPQQQQHPQLVQQQGQPLLPRPLLPLPPGTLQGHSYHPLLQQSIPNTRIPPPGLPPMGIPPPGLRHLNPAVLPPGMLRLMPPHLYPPRPPGFVFPPGGHPNQFPVNHPFNFPPPPRNINNMQQPPHHGPHSPHHGHHSPHHLHHHPQQQQQFQQQRQRHDSTGYGRQYEDDHDQRDHDQRDEYDGLMSMREKQWLLNIQMLQLNTGTPYFDDYYYTIFKERKTKSNKENINERNMYHQKRQHRNSDRQENQNTLTPRVYTPLQFENSLGKLQCGSVTAPRKIIDMDIVTPDKDGDGTQVSRDTRKTKQLLIELEALYALLLKAEDINNPLYISNMEKLREIKQKQRLRELELAPTPEQKQEILKLFKLESEPIIENQYEYIMKIVHGLFQEEKFCSFLNIRKGKMLILRLLLHLTMDMFPSQLIELWNKTLLSLPMVGRRDTAGDNILPKFFPFLKRFVQTRNMSDILEIVSGLVEVVKQENNRSTPLSHVGKSPLYFVLLNKFGVSALVSVLIRVEHLIATESLSEKQLNTWSNFLSSWAQQTEMVSKVATPIEFIPSQIFVKHCDRFDNLKTDKRSLLEKYFVDTNSNV
ncbi:unnamed protein product [Phaedon cochleariae]|uniref:Protein PAT1 homolog 1 n=1 Tax=Phaedon cochleariae TaxID=80249 RepID=A0A9P0DIN5_PHACE|nr:unnamed protein product [Phaedon cochleariae]